MTRPPPEDDPPTKPVGRPPPLRRKPSPSPSSAPNPDAGRFPDTEAPTRPRGIQAEVALLAQYYREMAAEDRERIMWEAEHYAARNRK